MDHKIRITFIAPYQELEQEVEKAFQQLGYPNVYYKVLSLTPDEEPLISQLESDVIISRGLAAAFFHTLKIPTVELSTTGYDLILAVQKAVRKFHSDHLAVIGTESMIFDTLKFSTIFPGIQVDCYRITSRSQIGAYIQKARDSGASALIGGRSLLEHAAAEHVPCMMVENSTESIIKSIEMAMQLVEATREERAKADRVAKIMDYSFSGILSTDINGNLSDINRKACAILGVQRDSALGQHISRIIPGIDVDEIILHGKKLLDELCHVGSSVVSINCVPIEGDKNNSGAVITCQEAQEVQKTEAKIRKKILQKGFVAHYHFSDIIGEDAAMQAVLARAERFSNNQANILLYGETGVGKELFAQSIHNASGRSKGPFVAINCAALPEQLLESELFGYVEGAFTGAARGGKMGLFEIAHCGTIFLDEIGDLSLKLQGRLLRVLQEKEIVRLGDDHVVPVDIRIISATNKDLASEVAQGNFRSDLMYRLDVLKLTIPPLRHRKKDIVPLFWHFVQEYRTQGDLPLYQRIAAEAVSLLENYEWYGNVRQLRNAAQRLSILWDQEEVPVEAVCEALEIEEGQGGREASPQPDAIDAQRIQEALEKAHYKKSAAAQLLGIDRSTLWRKMQKYHLD